MFAKMRNAMAQAQGAMGMMRTGLAEKHYVAGSKERIDLPAQQSATIADCGARTITHLDLKAKTYYVISLTQPPAPHVGGGSHPAPAPAAAPSDDGTKVALTVVNTALGAKTVFGNTATGYASDITLITTKPGGDASTSKMNRKEYVSTSSRLWPNCSAAAQSGSGMGFMSALRRYDELARGMATHDDPRLTVSSSGPTLPWTLAYFEAFQFSGDNGEAGGGHSGHGGAVSILIERNNIRSIGSDDPVFSAPADFTKVDAP
jgi:hypothetical protein